MADAIVQVTLQGASGLSEDVFMNTWAVTGASGDSEIDNGLASAFASFYQDLSSFLSARISQLENAHTVALYNFADTEPRAPYAGTFFTLDLAGTQSLPNELAICLSLAAAPVSGTPAARRRGRVYLGPWDIDTLITGNEAGNAVVGSSTITTITDAAQDLQTAVSSVAGSLAIWSRMDNDFKPVVSGWVDNEFDIQRRRGTRATTRNPFVF